MNYDVVLNCDKAINDLKELIDNKCKFVIKFNKRENEEFRIRYSIRKSYIENVIKSLKKEDFVEYRINNNPNYPDTELLIFKKKVSLVEAIKGIEKEILLYIKLNLVDKNNCIVVISFHEAKYDFK